MDNIYLQELIWEAQSRGGGLILNVDNQPAAVVLTVDKYNELLNHAAADPVAPAARSQYAMNMDKPKILVTGGAGYIGGHLVKQLCDANYEVSVIDNLSTGKRENVDSRAKFVEGDLADENLLRDVLTANGIGAVFHMAASIEVEESVRQPDKYFNNNVVNTAKLLLAMQETGVKKIIFSSSAAVYGEQEQQPISETAKLRPNNPYGHTKMLGEKLIRYFCQHAGMRSVVFRYFNACGCDFDGKIKPTHESHLIPIVLGVAAGKRPAITVYGDDYNTTDGTCLRDYVHVLDICHAHLLALPALDQGDSFKIYNIGTGKGLSVKEIINGASETLNKIIPMEIGTRRAGDAPATVADNTKISRELDFSCEYSDLPTIINTSWKQING
ncbi:MAG: UDP-glucose 4-epimerase GalE [Patescibacteria group bacterium]|nr:UDP-glucose 4-epimerase GalE [Patescibacteria group bacterium]